MEGETIIPQKKKRRRGMVAELQSNWRNEFRKKIQNARYQQAVERHPNQRRRYSLRAH
jgi:hypothetical protein